MSRRKRASNATWRCSSRRGGPPTRSPRARRPWCRSGRRTRRAALVRDLRAEEDPHLLVGRGAHDRPELGGDALLADEERAHAIHPLEALLLAEAFVPVD